MDCAEIHDILVEINNHLLACGTSWSPCVRHHLLARLRNQSYIRNCAVACTWQGLPTA